MISDGIIGEKFFVKILWGSAPILWGRKSIRLLHHFYGVAQIYGDYAPFLWGFRRNFSQNNLVGVGLALISDRVQSSEPLQRTVSSANR